MQAVMQTASEKVNHTEQWFKQLMNAASARSIYSNKLCRNSHPSPGYRHPSNNSISETGTENMRMLSRVFAHCTPGWISICNKHGDVASWWGCWCLKHRNYSEDRANQTQEASGCRTQRPQQVFVSFDRVKWELSNSISTSVKMI